MPYTIKKQGNRYCVRKKSGGNVPGGCHATQDEAQRHMRALYASVNDATDKRAEGAKIQKAARTNSGNSGGSSEPKDTDYIWKGR